MGFNLNFISKVVLIILIKPKQKSLKLYFHTKWTFKITSDSVKSTLFCVGVAFFFLLKNFSLPGRGAMLRHTSYKYLLWLKLKLGYKVLVNGFTSQNWTRWTLGVEFSSVFLSKSCVSEKQTSCRRNSRTPDRHSPLFICLLLGYDRLFPALIGYFRICSALLEYFGLRTTISGSGQPWSVIFGNARYYSAIFSSVSSGLLGYFYLCSTICRSVRLFSGLFVYFQLNVSS